MHYIYDFARLFGEVRMDKDEISIPFCENEVVQQQIENHSEKQSETIEIDKKKKIGTSKCWKYFTKIEVDKDGKERAKCIGCNKIFLCSGRKYGMSHLNRHATKCDKYKTEDIGQMMLDINGKLKAKKIDQGMHRQLLCEAIVEHNLPYNFV